MTTKKVISHYKNLTSPTECFIKLLKWVKHSNGFIPLALSLLGGFFVVYSITDADIFWHLASGREMFAQKHFLIKDPFAFTPTNPLWINLHWFFQLIMFTGYCAGGYLPLLLIKWAAVSGTIALLISSFPKKRSTLFIAATLTLTVYFQRYLIPLRPIIFTLFYLGIFIATYERFIKTGHIRWPLLTMATQIAWVNSQGLYLAGPAIGAAYAAGELLNYSLHRRKRFPLTYTPQLQKQRFVLLALLPAILFLISFINPYGTDAIPFAGNLFHRITPSTNNIYSRSIAENLPLLQMQGTMYAHYPAVIYSVVVLLLGTTLRSIRTVRFSLLGLAAIGLVLAFMAQRNGILFTFLAFPSLFYQAQFLRIPKTTTFNIATCAVLTVIMLANIAALVSHGIMLSRWPHLLSPFCQPVASAAHLKQHPQNGNLFNADRYGGYLIWQLFPNQKVSSDTRLTLRPNDYFREYMSIVNNPESFIPHAERWNIKTVILPLAPVPWYHELACYLLRHPHWSMVYTDGAEVMFTCSSTSQNSTLSLNLNSTIDSIVASLHVRYKSSPMVTSEALLHLAGWCALTGSYHGAERVLSASSAWQHKLMLASIRQKQGQLHEAHAIILKEQTLHPRNNHISMALIYFYLNSGHKERALSELSLLLKKNPFYRPARKLLFTLTREERQNQ